MVASMFWYKACDEQLWLDKYHQSAFFWFLKFVEYNIENQIWKAKVTDADNDENEGTKYRTRPG